MQREVFECILSEKINQGLCVMKGKELVITENEHFKVITRGEVFEGTETSSLEKLKR